MAGQCRLLARPVMHCISWPELCLTSVTTVADRFFGLLEISARRLMHIGQVHLPLSRTCILELAQKQRSTMTHVIHATIYGIIL